MSFAVVVLVVAAVAFVAWALYAAMGGNGLPRLPGPARLPVLGNVDLYLLGAWRGDVNVELQKAAAHGPLVRINIMTKPLIIASTLPLIRDLLQTAVNNYQNNTAQRASMQADMHRKVFGDAVLFTVGPKWRARRAAITPFFQPRSLNRVAEPAITRFGQQLLRTIGEAADSGRAIDIDTVFIEFTCSIVTAILLGPDFDWSTTEVGSTRRAVDSITHMNNAAILMHIPLPLFAKQHLEPRDLLRRSLLPIINKFRQSQQAELDSGQDEPSNHAVPLLQHLCRLKDYSDDDLLAEAYAIILAGTETTAHTLSFALMELSKNLMLQDRLHKEAVEVFGSVGHAVDEPVEVTAAQLSQLPFTHAVARETLRMHPSVPFLVVESVTPLELGGHKFPANVDFAVNLHGVLHDAEIFEEPFSFKPDRWLTSASNEGFPELHFSIGAHQCIGKSLAMSEAKAVLALISRAFTVALPSNYQPKMRNFGLLKPEDGVLIQFTRR